MKLLCILFAVAAAFWIPATADAYSYFTDFEDYSPGSVIGQDGWIDSSFGSDIYAAPYASIVADPTDSAYGNVLSMYCAGDNNWIGAYRPFGDLVAAGITSFSLSWDQYRPAFDGGITFSQDMDFEGWWGYQDTGTLYTNFFDSPFAELAAGVWQSLRFDFDVTEVTEFGVYGTAEGFLNNNSFGVAQSIVLDKFQGINFQISGNYGDHTSPIYIDNVSLSTVPEPSGIAAMFTGLTGLGWFMRHRKTQGKSLL